MTDPLARMAKVSMKSEIGRRLREIELQTSHEMLSPYFALIDKYPVQLRANMRGLLCGPDSQFRGALWELTMLEVLERSGCRVDFEFGELVGGPTVDFCVTSGPMTGVAFEVTSLSELHLDIARDFYLDDLMLALRNLTTFRNHWLHFESESSTLPFPATDVVVSAVQDWLMRLEFGSERHCLVSSHDFRLVDGASAWVLDFRAGHSELSAPGGLEVARTCQFIESDRLLRTHSVLHLKRKKRAGAPRRPFVIVVGEDGQWLGEDNWNRANVLYGAEVMHLFRDGSTQSGRDDGGFFLGPRGWNHPEISGVAFANQRVPRLGETQFQIWLNGGAEFPMDPESLATAFEVISLREDGLMSRLPGRGAWTPLALR